MEYLAPILWISLIHILALMSPGPDFIMVIKNSLSYGRRSTFFTALGLTFGIMVHITYCILGIWLIISQSIILFTVIKFIWAWYLIYIGIQAFLAKKSGLQIETETKKKEVSNLTFFKIWFLTNVLNPKATLYFLSIFTLYITPELPTWVIWTMSLSMVILTFVWFFILWIFFTHAKIRNVFFTFETILNKVFGSVLVFLGIKIATSSHK